MALRSINLWGAAEVVEAVPAALTRIQTAFAREDISGSEWPLLGALALPVLALRQKPWRRTLRPSPRSHPWTLLPQGQAHLPCQLDSFSTGSLASSSRSPPPSPSEEVAPAAPKPTAPGHARRLLLVGRPPVGRPSLGSPLPALDLVGSLVLGGRSFVARPAAPEPFLLALALSLGTGAEQVDPPAAGICDEPNPGDASAGPAPTQAPRSGPAPGQGVGPEDAHRRQEAL